MREPLQLRDQPMPTTLVVVRLGVHTLSDARLLAAAERAYARWSLAADGFPFLPTLEYPHWTVVLSTIDLDRFARVRSHFRGPVVNPAWNQE